LSGALTVPGTTFAGLGIAAGDYVWSLPNDTVTARFSPAPIPLPPALPLLLGGIGLMAAVARRRARG
jgi:hypothetical protein